VAKECKIAKAAENKEKGTAVRAQKKEENLEAAVKRKAISDERQMGKNTMQK
jgi:hypothetical protein